MQPLGTFVLIALILWSLYRQLQVQAVTTKSLIKLPAIFAGIGLLQYAGFERSLASPGAVVLTAVGALIGVGFGVLRGFQVHVWQDGQGNHLSQGTPVTLLLWALLLLIKIGLGAFGKIAGLNPDGVSTSEVFIFLALSFAAQNLIVAYRTIWAVASPASSR